MGGPVDPYAVLVLRGDGNGGRTLFRVQVILGIVFLVIELAWGGFVVSLGAEAGLGVNWLGFVPAFLLPILILAQAVAHQLRVRRLRGTEVWVSPQGVAYACADGWFGVPWRAVSWVGFGRGGTVLCIRAIGWRGPVSKLGSLWQSTRTLEVGLGGTDPATVAQNIHAVTGIHIEPRSV